MKDHVKPIVEAAKRSKREVQAQIRALESDLAELDRILTRYEGKPKGAKRRTTSARGEADTKIVTALEEHGDLWRIAIPRKANVPRGTVGGVLKRLEDDGTITPVEQRGKRIKWGLVDAHVETKVRPGEGVSAGRRRNASAAL